jgi:PIN domain nuclease of toxin-antitoxin system
LRVLLDTQVFLELAQQRIERFGLHARKLIEDEDSDLLLSSVSITEIAIKTSIKKLEITTSDTLKAIQDLRLILIPFEPRHAMLMFDLPLHHRDPFDRMLIATALSEAVPIITADVEFKGYRGLKVIS